MYQNVIMQLTLFRTNSILVTLILAVLYSDTVFAANSIDGIRVWPAPENTRIVFDVKQKTRL
jgi:N-acetylmuramoyl-L-alanine amidase